MTKKDEVFKILSDLKWHCSHELKSSQPAKIIQSLRDEGYEFESNDDNTRFCKTMFCKECNEKTTHRKLKSINKTSNSIDRVTFTPDFYKKVFKIYSEDEITGEKRLLEIDHRVTPKRTNGEDLILPDTEDEIKSRFMLLTKTNNNIKREACNKCIKTNIRQASLTGINYFYEGTNKYENTCVGCFWYNPKQWRESINNELHRK